MKKIIAITFVIIIAYFFIIWYKFPDNFYISSYVPNIVAELFGILITIFFVDYLLRIERKKQDDKYAFIAYKKIVSQIQIILRLLLQIYKASSNKNNIKKFESYNDFLSEDNLDHIFEHYAYFDFKKEAPVLPKQDWFEFTEHALNSSLKEVSLIIDRYLPFLDIIIVEKLENLTNDSQLLIIKNQKRWNIVFKQIGQDWRQGVQWRNKGLLKETFTVLLSIIKEISKRNKEVNFAIDQGLWSENVAPKVGSARFTDKELEEIIEKLKQDINS